MTALIALQAPARLVALDLQQDFPEPGKPGEILVAGVTPGLEFTEIIPSWNVDNAENARLRIDIRAATDTGTTKWYCLGDWRLNLDQGARFSIEDQKDSDGNVLTDIVRFARPARKVDVRYTLETLGEGPRPKLKLATLCFSNKSKPPVVPTERSAAWGKVIDVPQRAQGNYPRGNILCSPTSLSMVLWHYANQLGRPELNMDVPEVEQGVWDSVYEGAGNWPFNAAFAGAQPGIRSYISRLSSVADLEKWIDAGFPVICSAPLDMLKGSDKAGNSGHLVVLVGFNDNGDPVFNDPAKRDEVRRTYKREHFDRAWATSGRTVYIVHPEGAKVPDASAGLWLP